MRLRKLSKLLIIISLSLLTVSLLPGVVIVWAGAGLDFQKSGLNLESLIPRGQGRITRPPSNFEDNVVQYGVSPQDISAQNDGSGLEVVPAAAFVNSGELDSATQAEDWFYSFEGGYLQNESPREVCLMAPVYLQPGNTIRSFTAYLVDSTSTANLEIFLDRTYDRDFAWDELAAITSVGTSTNVQVVTDSSIAFNLVLPDFNYHINFCFPPNSGANIRVKGVSVAYSNPNLEVYLPLVLKAPPVVNTTLLTLKNSSGGTVIYYRVRNLANNNLVAQCPANIPNGAQQFCGTFPPGKYTVEGSFSNCGSGKTTLEFPAGNCVRTVTCPSEGGQKPSMQCN